MEFMLQRVCLLKNKILNLRLHLYIHFMAKKILEPTRRLKKPDGTIVYVWNGKLHNWDDAAVIHPDGKKEYYLFGFQYTKDQWTDRKRDVNGVPPAKDPKFDTRV